MKLSNEQKLLTVMLCEIHEKLEINSDVNVSLLKEAIVTGNDWAITDGFVGGFLSREVIDEEIKSFTFDVLDMYSFLAKAKEKLTKKDIETITSATGRDADDLLFPGFDGNNESEHSDVAEFITGPLNRFEILKSVASKNSHSPMLEIYTRMLEQFRIVRREIDHGGISVSQIIKVLSAKTHPDMRR